MQDGYAEIDAPYERVECPPFEIVEAWTAEQYLRHLQSWPGARYHGEAAGVDAVAAVRERVVSSWGAEAREVRWPLVTKVYIRC